MTGQPCLALWTPAGDSYPTVPTFAAPRTTQPTPWQSTRRNACAHLAYTYA